MEFNFTSVLTGLLGTIVGFIIKTAYDFFIYSKERHDKYFFALLSKRFEVYQEANYICEKLKKVLHDKTNNKINIANNAKEWYYKNHLYLSPELRDGFRRLIFDAEFYGDQLEDFYLTSADKGSKDPETQWKRKELHDTWNNIMTGTKQKLQEDLDKYFKKIE